MKTQTKESQSNMTHETALQKLKDGNKRYLNNIRVNRNLVQQITETAEGQYPFAVVLSCIDSRVPAEMIFDQGIGDLFSIRVAGNVVNEDVLGSMEFACKLAGAKLIVVLGHSSCGAIKGAYAGVEMGNLTGLLARIKPAIEEVENNQGRYDYKNNPISAVTRVNVELSAKQILEQSATLNEMVQAGEVKIVKAMYSVVTGTVTFSEQ